MGLIPFFIRMDISALVKVLDQPHAAADYLPGWGLTNVARGQQRLLDLAEAGLTLDLLAAICAQLGQYLPVQPNPDATLDAFCRYVFAVRSPLGLAALLERDPEAMPTLLAALSLGPRWCELLQADPDAFDLLRQTAGQPLDRPSFIADVQAEVGTFSDERAIVAALARIRQRNLLRIAFGEIFAQWPVETVGEQLSDLGDALVEAALAAAIRRSASAKHPARRDAARPPRVGVIALGPFGARDCDYRLPLEMLLVYDPATVGTTDLAGTREQMDRLGRLFVRLLSDSAEPGAEVGLVALPDSTAATGAHAADDVIVGYDSFGRTWHRQQLLTARAAAGDLDLGRSILDRLETWLFRRYLNRADETGIKALKRRIVLSATLHQDDWQDVRLARGGLRDIESTIAFLQLLSGGDQPAARRPSVLGALAGLYEARLLGSDEQMLLAESYRHFRRLAHGLQIASGPGSTQLPTDAAQLEQLAKSVGLAGDANAFCADLRRRQEATWQLLRKLLGSAFAEEPPTPREVDLLLAPQPPAEEVRAALAPFGFDNPVPALAALHDLAREQVPFLSTRRCRDLLATILPQLLCAIAATPQPDRTLGNLVRVSDSLGGKGVLWDLFRFHPPSLQLYVRLCAASPYLSGILTTNPGMIDELVDSLQLDKLPTPGELATTLNVLCRGASDTLPILHDFKNAEHLRIGVRELLGKEDIDRTHAALAAVAEACLAHLAELEYSRLVEKHGVPSLGPGPREGEPCRFVIVGLGELGGRELNYHSPLDLLFLYEADGVTRPGRSRRIERTANNHFFTQLAQRIIKQATELTSKGRLYAIETHLWPLGAGGSLALPLAEFEQHFSGDAAPLWHWQALCQARPAAGDLPLIESVAGLVRKLLLSRAWIGDELRQARLARREPEPRASADNLQRGPGGSLNVQFLVQLLQVQHAANNPDVLSSNTMLGLQALAAAGNVPGPLAEQLDHAYRFLRQVEAGLHLCEATRRHELPGDPLELAQLALLLGHGNPERLRDQCRAAMIEIRTAFDVLTA